MADKPSITPTPNGPYKTSNVDAVHKLADGTSLPAENPAMLCRCGGSANKPFCDGSHLTNNFNGDKDPARVPDAVDTYTNADGRLVISDNRGLCAHSGRCTDNLTEVFRLRTEPFIDPDAAAINEIAEVIDMCPSGALSYTLDGVSHRDRNDSTKVGFVPGGPYVLTNVQLEGSEPPKNATEDHFTLCRCGASTNKPFCSGAHWNENFDETTD